MMTGSSGTYVISWSQTEVEGVPSASIGDVTVGATWRWSGRAVRVDGPQGLLQLEGAEGVADRRQRAARMVRRLIGAAVVGAPDAEADWPDDGAEEGERGFVLTDGRHAFTATVVSSPAAAVPLVMFLGEVPPPDTDLWVMRALADSRGGIALDDADAAGGVICFAAGTMIRTDAGPRPIEALAAGDRVLTRDDGPQEILWVGNRRMSGARLYAMPALRPVRIRAGALGIDRPEPDLLVSPMHRILLRGRAAQALFNTPEVLVAARDLVNGRSIVIDRALREVTYVHLFLERHQVIWGNGVESESFHPANTALDLVEEGQRAALLAMFPEMADNPQAYGDFARRSLSTSEAAILRHDGGLKVA